MTRSFVREADGVLGKGQVLPLKALARMVNIAKQVQSQFGGKQLKPDIICSTQKSR